MTYEQLLNEAENNNLVTKEKPLRGSKGRIKGNKIAISKNIPTLKEKACILAEELGHHYTSVGDIIDQTETNNRKQELRARVWAYNKQIGLIGILNSYKNGCKNLHEMANYLDVTEQFLADALEYYKSKYGQFQKIDNYIIYFEPSLGVMELF